MAYSPLLYFSIPKACRGCKVSMAMPNSNYCCYVCRELDTCIHCNTNPKLINDSFCSLYCKCQYEAIMYSAPRFTMLDIHVPRLQQIPQQIPQQYYQQAPQYPQPQYYMQPQPPQKISQPNLTCVEVRVPTSSISFNGLNGTGYVTLLCKSCKRKTSVIGTDHCANC